MGKVGGHSAQGEGKRRGKGGPTDGPLGRAKEEGEGEGLQPSGVGRGWPYSHTGGEGKGEGERWNRMALHKMTDFWGKGRGREKAYSPLGKGMQEGWRAFGPRGRAKGGEGRAYGPLDRAKEEGEGKGEGPLGKEEGGLWPTREGKGNGRDRADVEITWPHTRQRILTTTTESDRGHCVPACYENYNCKTLFYCFLLL